MFPSLFQSFESKCSNSVCMLCNSILDWGSPKTGILQCSTQ